MTDEIAPQSVNVRRAEKHMERPIEVEVREQLNNAHATSSKVWLTPESARELRDAIDAFLADA